VLYCNHSKKQKGLIELFPVQESGKVPQKEKAKEGNRKTKTENQLQFTSLALRK